MNGVDPRGYMQDQAGRIDARSERGEIERALDDLEYLTEVPGSGASRAGVRACRASAREAGAGGPVAEQLACWSEDCPCAMAMIPGTTRPCWNGLFGTLPGDRHARLVRAR